MISALGKAACSASGVGCPRRAARDRKSTRLNSSHLVISYAVFCLKKKSEAHDRDPLLLRYDDHLSPPLLSLFLPIAYRAHVDAACSLLVRDPYASEPACIFARVAR